MATAKPPQLSAAIACFVEFLQKPRSAVGPVSLPGKLDPTFESVFSTKDSIDAVHLDELVSIVDGDGGALLDRLDIRAALVFTGLLRLARDGQSQQRGYLMLAEYLHKYSATDHGPNSGVTAKKRTLGPRHALASLNRFLDPDRSYHTRRAIGLFLLTVLSGSPANKANLVSECSEKTWRSLGNIIISQESETLKLLAGSIIREMLHHKVPEDKFWPIQETPDVIVNSFPRAADHTSQWVWNFHSYLNNDALHDAVDDRNEVATFARLVRLPDVQFESDEESSVLVTVTTVLSIMIPPSKTRCITYLDIPLDRITEIRPVKSDTQSQDQSQHSQSQTIRPCCLEIGLNNLQGWNYVLNAKPQHADSFIVLFDYPHDAKTINNAILAQRSTPYQTVSPSDLEYEGADTNEEAIIHQSDAIPLHTPQADFGDEAEPDADQLTAIASDVISHLPCSAARKDTHERSVDLGYNDETTVDEPQPLGAEDQPVFNKTDSIGDAIREIVPANQNSNVGRPRAPTNPPLEAKAKQKALLDDGTSRGTKNSLNIHDRQHTTQQSAMRSSILGHRQQADDYDPLYDASPPKPKAKPSAQTTTMPGIEAVTTTRHSDSSRPGSQKLSRQLRDQNGQVQDIDHGRFLTAGKSSLPSDKPLHQRSLEQRPSSTTHRPKASAASTSRQVGTKAKTGGQQRNALPMSTHDKEHPPPTVTTGHKATGSVQAPTAKMVAESNKREPRSKGSRPSNVSTSQYARPDLKDQTNRVSQSASAPKAKTEISVAHEEEVDWSEDLQVDDSDTTTKANKKKSLQPQARGARVQQKKKKKKALKPEARPAKALETKKGLQQQAKASKVQERQPTPTQQRKETLSGPMASVQSAKPKRAAAVKASNRIQGLTDNSRKKHSPVKGTTTKGNSKSTLVSKVPLSAAKAVESGLDTSAVQVPSTTSRKSIQPPSSAYTREPNATIRAPNEKVITGTNIQKTAQSGRERNAALKPMAISVAAEGDSVELRAMPESKRVGPVTVDHALLHELVEDSVLANEEAAQPVVESPIEQDTPNNLTHPAESNKPINAVDIDQLSGSHNADSNPPSTVQQALATPMKTGIIPRAIIEASSSNRVMQHTDFQEVNQKQRAVSSPAGSGSSLDPLARGSIDDKVKSAKKARPQDDSRLNNRQNQQAIIKEHVLQLNETDQHNQLEIGARSKSPSAPKEKRITASKLQVAISPLLVLATRRPDQFSAPMTQVVDEPAHHVEQDTIAKANGAINTHHVSSANKRQTKQKRYLEEEDTRQTKKSRASGWQSSLGPYSARPIVATPKNDKPIVDRKPRLVHFDSDGPKNQGIQSAQKSARRGGSRSGDKRKDVPHEPAPSSKRKHVSLMDEQRVISNSTPNEKRRKMNAAEPTLTWKEKAETVSQRLDKPNATGRHGKPSSQSSRVDEHGSPMPFHHSRHTSLIAPVVMLALHDASDEDPIACQTDINTELEPQLPVAPYHKIPPIFEPKVTVASNTKHRPSSPNAPSSIVTDMAAHRVQPSGNFLEIQTNSVVVPTIPQDPFTGTTRDRPYNHFTETLRKSNITKSKEIKQSRNEQREKEKSSDGRKDEDPDKTVVGESLSEDDRESSTASESGSGSNNSKSPGEADVEPSDDGSDPGSGWLRGLRPDHTDTLNALYEISHQLVRDLIDKETAITDLINDYREGGHLRIDRYEEERDRNFEIALANDEKAKRELVKLLQSEERKCAADAGSFDKEVADLRSTLEAQERMMNASLDAALALCEEE